MQDAVPIKINPLDVGSILYGLANPFKFKQRYALNRIKRHAKKAGHTVVKQEKTKNGYKLTIKLK